MLTKQDISTIGLQWGKPCDKTKNKVNSMVRVLNYAIKDNSYESIDRALDICNKILGGYGIEAIQGSHWQDYYLDIVLLYVNMGDTYDRTIVYDTIDNKFHITGWGDFVENSEFIETN